MPKNHSFRCWVPHCVNARKRTRIPDSHFHAFPVKNAERCRRWLQAVGYEDLVYLPLYSLKMRYVCSEHFTENDYGKTGSNPSLLFTATPSKFPPGTIPLSDEILEEWPPKLASDKGDIPQMETAMLDSLDHTGQIVLTIPSSDDSSDKLLASVVSAGILQPAPPKVAKVTPVTQAEQSANPEEEKLSPLPQELLLKHLKNNSGQGLLDGDMLLGFLVQRGASLEVVPVGPGHSTMVASCLEELLSPNAADTHNAPASTSNGLDDIR